MNRHPIVLCRTFEAKTYPKGSPERARLNCDVKTSEYYPSYRYLCRYDNPGNPAQPTLDDSFRTKTEAGERAERIRREDARPRCTYTSKHGGCLQPGSQTPWGLLCDFHADHAKPAHRQAESAQVQP